LIQPAFEIDTGGDAAVMELVRVNGLPVLGALIP